MLWITSYPARHQATRGSLALAPGPDVPQADATRTDLPRLRVISGESPSLTALTRLMVEVLAGARSAQQLTPWASPRVQAALTRLRPVRPGRPVPRIVSWRVQYPAARVAEVTAVAQVRGRCHGLALRCERYRSAEPWCCVVIETTIPR